MPKKYISITLNNIYKLDVIKAEELPLVFAQALCAIEDVTLREGIYSKTLKLPGTKNNQLIFGQLYSPVPEGPASEASNVANVSDYRSYPYFDCEVVVNGITHFKGKLKALNSSFNRNPTEYEVAFYSDNGDWVVGLRDKKLCDLDNWAQTIDWTEAKLATVNTDFKNNPNTQDWCLPLINYGKWGSYALKTFKYADLPVGEDKVGLVDYRPSIRILSYVKNILRAQGYQLQSNFMNGKFFRNLHMPFCIGDWRWKDKGSKTVLQAQYNGGGLHQTLNGVNPDGWQFVNFDDDSTAGNFDTYGAWNTGPQGVFVVPYAGTYRFEFEFINLLPAPSEKKVSLMVAGKYRIPFDGIGISPFVDANGLGIIKEAGGPTSKFNTAYVRLEAGDRISLFAFDADNTVSPFNQDVWLDYAQIVVQGQFDVVEPGDTDIPMKTVVPCLPQMAFLQGLIQKYNLIVKTDTFGKVAVMEPKHDCVFCDEHFSGFYNRLLEYEDWTNRFDITQGDEPQIEVVNDLANELFMKYKQDGSDTIVNEVQEDLKQSLYQASYKFDLAYSKTSTEEKENSFFAPTHHIRDLRLLAKYVDNTSAVLETYKPPYLPRIWSGGYGGASLMGIGAGLLSYPDQTFKSEPRVLYFLTDYASNLHSDDPEDSIGHQPWFGYVFYQFVGGVELPTNFITGCSFMVNYDNEADPDGDIYPNMSFADEVTGGLNKILQKGLLSKCWLNTFACLRSGLKLNAKFYLKDIDIQTMNWSKLKIVDNNVYMLYEISEFSLINNSSSKCILLMFKRIELIDHKRVTPFRYLTEVLGVPVYALDYPDLNNQRIIDGIRTLENY